MAVFDVSAISSYTLYPSHTKIYVVMPPKIVLIRHAQAMHNAAKLGLEQCAKLRQSLLDRFSDVKPEDVAIIASPMRRTLQTAMESIDWLVERGVKIQADADWQENADKPCDIGSPITSLSAEFPQNVDFSAVDPIWPDKTSPSARRYAYTRSSILERGNRCLENLYNRPERLVLVFSHAAFLRLGVVGWWFFNAEYRIFEFEGEDRSIDGGVRKGLIQDESTLAGGLGTTWTTRVELGSELPDDQDVSVL